MCSEEDKNRLQEKVFDLSKDINSIFAESKNKKLLKISTLTDELLSAVHLI